MSDRLRALSPPDLGRAGAWRRAAEIRAFVAAAAARAAVLADAAERLALADWEGWALAQADRLDPLVGGSVMDVLRFTEPTIPPDDDEDDYDF